MITNQSQQLRGHKNINHNSIGSKIRQMKNRRILQMNRYTPEKSASMKRFAQGILLVLIVFGAPLLILSLFRETERSSHGAVGREIHNSGACNE